jgi:hypothetical protein
MGAEYLALSSEDEIPHVGHHATFTFVGDVESVRARLVSAVEKLGYLIVEENPIIARYTKSKYSSGSILDYVNTLTLRLKVLSESSTRAIFEYKYVEVYGKSGRAVLTQQAKAIAAFASDQNRLTVCPSCGTQATDESRFCRQCGGAMHGVPAELEVMKITAESHAGYLCFVQAAVGFFLAFLTLILLMALKGPEYIVSALVFTMIWAVPSFVLTFYGFRRLKRTFKVDDVTDTIMPSASSPLLNSQPANAHFSARTSVTEGTTELLKSANVPDFETARKITGKL